MGKEDIGIGMRVYVCVCVCTVRLSVCVCKCVYMRVCVQVIECVSVNKRVRKSVGVCDLICIQSGHEHHVTVV